MPDKKTSGGEKLLNCSFCGKSQPEVEKLIAGPSVFICNECVDLCQEIIANEAGEPIQFPAADDISRELLGKWTRISSGPPPELPDTWPTLPDSIPVQPVILLFGEGGLLTSIPNEDPACTQFYRYAVTDGKIWTVQLEPLKAKIEMRYSLESGVLSIGEGDRCSVFIREDHTP